MYKSWFHMELIIYSYVMGKGGKRLGILICQTKNSGSMFATLRGGSIGENFHPRVDVTFVTHSQMLQPTNPILNT